MNGHRRLLFGRVMHSERKLGELLFAVRSEVFILMRRDIALAYRHPHYTHKMPEAPLAPLIWISLFLFL